MELGENWLANTFLVLLIIVGALYLIFKSDDDSKKSRKRRRNESTIDPYASRQTGRNAPRRSSSTRSRGNSNQTKSSIIRSAKREESRKNYDEASDLYLKGDQVYSAAKMKAMKGPTGGAEVISLIEIHSPDQIETITRNLVNEFYYRLNQPATAAAILRAWGHNEEAIAVEVAAGIPTQAVTMATPNVAASSFEPEVEHTEADTVDISYQESIEDSYTATEDTTDLAEETVTETPKMENISNTLLMASVTLSDGCSVCKRAINTGDSFIQCLSCGKPGHYKHLAEMIKVTGKCPKCRQRLVISMFDL